MNRPDRIAVSLGRVTARFDRRAVVILSFLALCGFITLVGSADAADAAGALGVLVGAAASGTVFVSRARSLSGRERLGWSLVGVGLLIAAAGVLVVGIVFTVAGDAPAFGWTDLFFITTYIVMITGFSLLPHTSGSPLQRIRIAIDGLIGAVAVGALLWVYVISDLTHDLESATTTARVIGALYPFLDLALLSVAVIVLLRRSAYRFDFTLGLFTVGVAAQVLGDVAFFSSATSGSFQEAQPLYVVNLFAMAAFFASAQQLGHGVAPKEYADRTTPLWIQVAPYVPAVGMLLVFVIDTYLVGASDVNVILLTAMILVGLLVIARQGVAIIDNRAQIEQQRDALVSTISHELRTPLTAIVGFTELLDESGGGMTPSERKEMLGIVRQQADYMSRIVSDLIMLARGENDLALQVERVSMIDLAKESIQVAGIPANTVTIECPPLLRGFVDPDRIKQVLVNLLTNAARYGGPHRHLLIRSQDSDLVIEVHDDGAGVPRRYEVRIWDRFERGPNRLNAAIPGSGIGLAIVEAIAVKHGGTASLRTSELLGGACFAVNLPGRAAVGRNTAPHPDAAPAHGATRAIS